MSEYTDMQPWRKYQDLLDTESRSVPKALREVAPFAEGRTSIAVERYLSREFYELEKERLWPCVWQAVCRETEVPQAGDYVVHQVVDAHILVVRIKSGELRAYHNVCLHRGRQLKAGGDVGGGYTEQLQCPYHGFTWSLEGEFLGAPCQWDFPHIDTKSFQLPQVRIACWGGWVFVNQSAAAPSLDEYLGPLVEHFERWQPATCHKLLHVRKVIRCNWKLAHEAFIESFHTVATHPQLLPYTGDVQSQYDCFTPNISRSITPMGVASSNLGATSAERTVGSWLAENGLHPDAFGEGLGSGTDARNYLGEMNLQRFSAAYGRDLSNDVTHSEILDAILYSVFPNFAPWAGFRPNLTYRFLPWDDDHRMCSMEIMLLSRYDESNPRPPDAKLIHVEADQLFADTQEISPGLAKVFDQDFSNLPEVQRGLHSLQSGLVTLGRYQESRISHFHKTLDSYLFDNAE